jgi:hypothetical protein
MPPLASSEMQQVEPLCRQLTAEKVDPCQVATRPGEAGDKTKPDRVFGGNEDFQSWPLATRRARGVT